ncbi:MAG: aspartate/glutamate racemase family protein [Halomonas sp.]|nr:aspartate/glutamate racemase family protein [Halomonas sp.]MDN6297550.1 aspartate/glutamate racemase family protein [Halomonas sp.]MDN6314954.1 aspartate/glutamate racemase family protein [Halomonas sp.]MDN6336210.1 aspartate/glutamate racemase family protein [Halomonas sp.]
MKHVTLVNANTNEGMTDHMARLARARLGNGVQVMAQTAAGGTAYIGSPRTCAMAAAAAADMVEETLACVRRGEQHMPDAFLLGCFGDPGLAAVRDISPVPVISMLEASLLTALQLGERFAIVTPGQRWPRMIDDTLAQLGIARQCLGIDAIVLDNLHLPEQQALAVPELQRLVDAQAERYSPAVIIIGGAALAGLHDAVVAPPGVCLLNAFDAALAQVAGLMTLPGTSHAWSPQRCIL